MRLGPRPTHTTQARGFDPQLGWSPPSPALPFLLSTTISPSGPADGPPDRPTTGPRARSSTGQTPLEQTGTPDDPIKTPDPAHALISLDPIRSDPIRSDPIRRRKIASWVQIL
ncbi:hypothetical protein PGTUg99_022917 [Puccinia graminis f. sp. tritici]|uniref:Uncharacterized protein n=1 Tax=Puccinia graminis f. sp. tritici TaxID=56615 RepID=A0A5B0PGQ4_PUCGR|nr:hypothetical protein PGTUg99_022917 [Puccinia graminis f. sp. tritici]